MNVIELLYLAIELAISCRYWIKFSFFWGGGSSHILRFFLFYILYFILFLTPIKVNSAYRFFVSCDPVSSYRFAHCFALAKLISSSPMFFKFVTVIVAKLKLKSANLKVKWPTALYDFDKSRPLGRALHFKNNEPGLIKNCLLNRAEKRRLWTGF